jgi:hypothetical protein
MGVKTHYNITTCAFVAIMYLKKPTYFLNSRLNEVNIRLHSAFVLARLQSLSANHCNGGELGYKGLTNVAVL